jgi:DNA primase
MKTAGIEITHPGKTMYPEKEITKGEVVGYYDRVAERMLPFLKDRPLTLKRYPDGLKGPGFFPETCPGLLSRFHRKDYRENKRWKRRGNYGKQQGKPDLPCKPGNPGISCMA